MAEQESREKELEGMLRAIQDLKEEYYIGTQDAFEYLKNVQRVYSYPEKIADSINEKITSRELSYPATAARVAGLENTINDAVDEIEFDIHMSIERDFDVYKVPSIFLYGKSQILNLLSYENMFIDANEERVDAMSYLFADANKLNIQTNPEFGANVVQIIRDSYDATRDEIDTSESYMNSDEFIEKLAGRLLSRDWDNCLSEINLRKMEKEAARAMFFCLSLEDMVNRLVKDKVENNMEYRRAVLCKWIQDYHIEAQEDYSSLVVAADRSIVGSRRRLKEDLIKYPENHFIVMQERKNLQRALFIRHVLGREKSFVISYLKQ